MGLTLGHMVTRQVDAPADFAFACLSDPLALGRWSLGCFATSLDEQSGVYTGHSLFDGSQAWFSVHPEPSRMLVDFAVGAPGSLQVRISARVVDSSQAGDMVATCIIMLSAWRPHGMAAERWERLCASHEAEIWLIKAQIETEYRKSHSREM